MPAPWLRSLPFPGWRRSERAYTASLLQTQTWTWVWPSACLFLCLLSRCSRTLLPQIPTAPQPLPPTSVLENNLQERNSQLPKFHCKSLQRGVHSLMSVVLVNHFLTSCLWLWRCSFVLKTLWALIRRQAVCASLFIGEQWSAERWVGGLAGDPPADTLCFCLKSVFAGKLAIGLYSVTYDRVIGPSSLWDFNFSFFLFFWYLRLYSEMFNCWAICPVLPF